MRDLLSSIGLGAALAFGAYLLGAALEPFWSWPLSKMRPTSSVGRKVLEGLIDQRIEALPREALLIYAWTQSTAGRAALEDIAVNDDRVRGSYEEATLPNATFAPQVALIEAVENSGDDLFWRVRGVVRWELVKATESELDMVARQLIGNEQDLFEDYDRMRAEAEFRLATALPLGLLLAAVLWEALDPVLVVLMGLSVVALFVEYAARRRHTSGDRIVGALAYERVWAPALGSLEPGSFTRAALLAGDLFDRRIWKRPTMLLEGSTSFVGRRLLDVTQSHSVEILDAIGKRNVIKIYASPFKRLEPEELERQRRLGEQMQAGEAGAYVQLGDELRDRGNRRAARTAYSTPASWGYSPAHLRLGKLAADEGKRDQAEIEFRRALLSARSAAEVHAARGALAELVSGRADP